MKSDQEVKLSPYQANVSTETKREVVPLMTLFERICVVPLVVLVLASESLLASPVAVVIIGWALWYDAPTSVYAT